MNNTFALQSIFEILVAAFLIWGLFNEEKLVDFEDKVLAIIKALVRRRRMHRKRSANAYRKKNARRLAS